MSTPLGLCLALLVAAVAGVALPRSRFGTIHRQKRNSEHIIRDCMLVTSEPGHYFFKSVGEDPTVCGVYLMTDPDKIIQLQFDYLDLPCNTGGLVSFVDGWELNGGYFPEVGEHRLRLEDRVTEFCGLNRPARAFLSSQNAALVQYRVPKRARGFSFRVTFLKNPTHDPQLPGKPADPDPSLIDVANHGIPPTLNASPTNDSVNEILVPDSEGSHSSSHPGIVVRTDVIQAHEFRGGGGVYGGSPCGGFGSISSRIQRGCPPTNGNGFGGYPNSGSVTGGTGLTGFGSIGGGSQGGFSAGVGSQAGLSSPGAGCCSGINTQGGFGSLGGYQGAGFATSGGGSQRGYGSIGGTFPSTGAACCPSGSTQRGFGSTPGGFQGIGASGSQGGSLSPLNGCCGNSGISQGFGSFGGALQGGFSSPNSGCCGNTGISQGFGSNGGGLQGGFPSPSSGCCGNIGSGGFGSNAGGYQGGFVSGGGGTQSGLSSPVGGCCPPSIGAPGGFATSGSYSPLGGKNQGDCCSGAGRPQGGFGNGFGSSGGAQGGFGGSQGGGFRPGGGPGVITGSDGWNHKPVIGGGRPGLNTGPQGGVPAFPGIQGSYPGPGKGPQGSGGEFPVGFPAGGFSDGRGSGFGGGSLGGFGLGGGGSLGGSGFNAGCQPPNGCGDPNTDKNKGKGTKYETKETKALSTSDLQRVVLIEQLKATRLLKDYYNQLLGKTDPDLPIPP